MKRNVIVVVVVIAVLGALGLAGWANWKTRQQAIAKQQAIAAQQSQAVLVKDGSDPSGDIGHMTSPLIGKAAPNFTLTNLAGEKVSLSSYKGKAVQLNFWATWCAPCKIETPWIVDLRKQYGPKGFEVLGVSFDDLDPEDKFLLAKEMKGIQNSVKTLGIDYPVLLNGDSISKPYGDPDMYPTSYFIDRQGKITGAVFGLKSKKDLEDNIVKALGEGM
jgi:thiol-disulfide isomerase/thioredoxin